MDYAVFTRQRFLSMKENKGFTQTFISKKLGVTRQALSQFLNNKGTLSLNNLQKLNKILDTI